MKLKIIICFIFCLPALVSFVSGQNSPNKPDELPKITDGSIQGKTRKILLRGFCKKTADCEQFIVKKVERVPQISDVGVYSVTRQNHFSEYILRYKNKSYITLEGKDFSRLLKDYEILSKPNLLSNFLQVYRYFKFDDGAINPFYIIDEAYLMENSEELKKYESGDKKIVFRLIHPPKIININNGVEIEFYADSPLSAKLLKITVTIFPKYRIQETSILYRIEVPAEIN